MGARVNLLEGVSTETKQDEIIDALGRTLTERMMAKAPSTGKTLYVDVASTDYFYIAEADAGSDPTADTEWDGIRITLNADGTPEGAVGTSTGFVWDDRASATWDE